MENDQTILSAAMRIVSFCLAGCAYFMGAGNTIFLHIRLIAGAICLQLQKSIRCRVKTRKGAESGRDMNSHLNFRKKS
jgi:hypothetical protein